MTLDRHVSHTYAMATTATTSHRDQQNRLFDALANHRRRFTLYACNEAGGELDLGSIAEQVAAWEYDKPIEEVTSSERKRVYTSLQQHHLKRLTEAGLVEIDGDVVTLTDTARKIDLYLEVVPGETIPWSVYYLGLGVIAAVAVAITLAFELPAFVTLEVVVIGIIVAFMLSAGVHFVDSRDKELDALEAPSAIVDQID